MESAVVLSYSRIIVVLYAVWSLFIGPTSFSAKLRGTSLANLGYTYRLKRGQT